jgi:hypothetical protein
MQSVAGEEAKADNSALGSLHNSANGESDLSCVLDMDNAESAMIFQI